MTKGFRNWAMLGGALGIVLAEFVLVPAVEAIVGRPATPASVAGVARRTTRRAVVVTAGATTAAAANQTAAANEAAYQSAAAADEAAAAANQAAAASEAAAASAAAAAPAPAPTAMVASLPDGCVSAGEVFQCGSVYYKPYLSGTQVVYGVVPGP